MSTRSSYLSFCLLVMAGLAIALAGPVRAVVASGPASPCPADATLCTDAEGWAHYTYSTAPSSSVDCVWTVTVSYGDGASDRYSYRLGQSLQVSHRFPAPGRYQVTIAVTNGQSPSGKSTCLSGSRQITVVYPGPPAPLSYCHAYFVPRGQVLSVPVETGLLSGTEGASPQPTTIALRKISFAASKLVLSTSTGSFAFLASAKTSTLATIEYDLRDAQGREAGTGRAYVFIGEQPSASLCPLVRPEEGSEVAPLATKKLRATKKHLQKQAEQVRRQERQLQGQTPKDTKPIRFRIESLDEYQANVLALWYYTVARNLDGTCALGDLVPEFAPDFKGKLVALDPFTGKLFGALGNLARHGGTSPCEAAKRLRFATDRLLGKGGGRCYYYGRNENNYCRIDEQVQFKDGFWQIHIFFRGGTESGSHSITLIKSRKDEAAINKISARTMCGVIGTCAITGTGGLYNFY